VAGRAVKPGISKADHISGLLEVTCVELNDLVSNYKDDDQVDETRRPLSDGVEFSGAFLLKIAVKTDEYIIKLSADFS
jgi:hypothetical protein